MSFAITINPGETVPLHIPEGIQQAAANQAWTVREPSVAPVLFTVLVFAKGIRVRQ